MKAQAALEYMLVVMLAMGFLVPVWIYMITVNVETDTEFSLSYAKNTVETIAYTADLVYSQGPPAKVTIQVFIPEGVESVIVTNSTISILMRYKSEFTDVFATSKATLNGTLPTISGNYQIELEAIDNYVRIKTV